MNTPLSMASLERLPYRENPYPFYRRLREQDPVHWDVYWNAWVLTRSADITTLLRDARLSARIYDGDITGAPESVRQEATLVAQSHAQKVLFVDPPVHTRLRALMNRAFSPRMVEQLRPMIENTVGEILDRAVEAGRLDVIADLAFPLPAFVIAELLGVPHEDREQFKRWSTDMALDFGVPWSATGSLQIAKIEAQQGVAALLLYMERLVKARRHARQDDLLQALVDAREEDGSLSEDELIANSAFLLFAGHETTTNLIGNGMLALLRHPEELEHLRNDPSLVPTAVEEMLRYDAPVQFASRLATEPIELDGKRIEPGQRIRFCLGAANRDPKLFPNPDRLDVGRRPNRQVAFSHGIHFCLGAALARLEGQIVFGMLLKRFLSLELMDQRPQWRPNPDFRGLEELQVSCKNS